jgi:hypothetical protein
MLLQLPQTPTLSNLNVSESSVTIPDVPPFSHLHCTLNIQPFPVLIHRLTDKFFAHCPLHSNSPAQQIGTYAVADRTDLYNKYNHNRKEAHTALISLPEVAVFVFWFIIFHCRYLQLYLHTHSSVPLVPYCKYLFKLVTGKIL